MPVRNLTGIGAPGMGPLPQAGWTTPVPPLNEQHLIECVNTSAGTLAHGDVVVVDTASTANATTGWIPQPAVASPPISPQASGVAVTTTTSANSRLVVGVISVTGDASTNSGTVAVGANCLVAIGGIARVQIAAQVVVANDSLATAAVAKTAVGTSQASIVLTQVGVFFGTALEATAAKDANNTIRALIKSH